jgi:hypothetical protein
MGYNMGIGPIPEYISDPLKIIKKKEHNVNSEQPAYKYFDKIDMEDRICCFQNLNRLLLLI